MSKKSWCEPERIFVENGTRLMELGSASSAVDCQPAEQPVQELESRFLDPIGTPPRRITRYKFIHFVEIDPFGRRDPKRKTSVWECRNNRSDDALGRVQWYGPWRQYCFFPEPIDGLVFNDGCLKDICHFMGQLRGGK